MTNTQEQLLAINEEGSNIIVSAGAGSGKTAVLTQRVIRKILNGVDVNKLLILTFTNEAANEMKNRIRSSIIKEGLTDQLTLLDSAYITTFDSFALQIVKKYAYLLNISQNVGIIDSTIITIHKYKIIDKIFEDSYGNEAFDKLVDDFCEKNDENLKKEIINLSNTLDLQIDKDKFIETYFEKYGTEDFISKIITKYNLLIKEKISELIKIYEKLKTYLSDSSIKKLDDYFKCLINGVTYADYVSFSELKPPRILLSSEEGQTTRDELKQKITEIKELIRFKDEQAIRSSITKTYSHIELIFKIIKMIDNEVNQYKNKYEVYEFNDIAHMAIKIVKENSDIQAELKTYFNEIMIDEYQDTSDIQEEFINLISNNNVYMVGDIKQSIYRFRNANPYIFQKKYNDYNQLHGGIKIDLLKNFRSRKETLISINEIFNLIMDDEIGNANYQLEHNMIYGNETYDLEDTKTNNFLEIYNYSITDDLDYTKEEKELFIISEDIITKIKNKYQVFDKSTQKLRNIKFSDICIITDRKKYMDTYKKILEYHEIPSVLYIDFDLTNNNTIMILKNLILLVNNVNTKNYDEKLRYLFTSVARSFIFEYPDQVIYKRLTDKTIFDDEIIAKCRLINMDQPLQGVINDILNEFSIYDKLTKLHSIDEEIVRISNLLDIANSLSNLNYNLEEFVDYLDEVTKRDLPIKYSVNENISDAVKIMNIHKSKGLEFPLCYFAGMHNKFTIKELNSKILYNDSLGIVLPSFDEDNNQVKTILKDLYVNAYYKEEISEKIRLFYVALTRCREKMIIVTSLNENCEKYNCLVPRDVRIKYRSFLDILNSIQGIDKYITTKKAKYTHAYRMIKMKDIPNHSDIEKINKKTIPLNYQISNLKHFSKETSQIFDKETIKLMEYGTKIHESLEYIDFFETNNEIVNKLFEKFEKDYQMIYREYEFKYFEDGNEYHGVIDLMIEYTDWIAIIDYKLKKIEDKNYLKQLAGYRNYIESISQKKVKTYLYSIIDKSIKEII